MRTEEIPGVGFAFRPSREALRHFKGLPAEVKLDWLEQAVQFIDAFLSPEKRSRWDRRLQRDSTLSISSFHSHAP